MTVIPSNTIPWNDDAIRPPNADETIGWAGVPLSATCGYYGHIKRAVLPTNSELGFAPQYTSVSARKLTEDFLASFSPAVEKQDVKAILDHLYVDGYWKDVELLTWDIRNFQGHKSIGAMLNDRLSKTGMRNIRINPQIEPTIERLGDDLSFVLFHLEFDFMHGTGVAVIRLSPLNSKTGAPNELADFRSWKVYTIGTALESIQGWDAEHGDKIRYQHGKVHDPLGKGRHYADIREDEVEGREGFDPAVVIIGAGHTGLTMAARFKVLGIPCLIIEKGDRPGYSWANRYASLSLHGPTFTNHMPCVPFPHWFPIFLPAQQLAKFMKHYAEIMDLNVWTNSSMDGQNAIYDEETGKWTISVTRGDGIKHVLHPRHLMIATGISGTLPNVPEIPGMSEFEKNGGTIVHSSRHRTGPDWRGKRCIVVGAATSAHDICYELSESGCEVTMIQRSATHVMSVEKSVRHLFRARELTNRRGGQTTDIMDQANFLKQPYPVEYEILQRGQELTRHIDKELLSSLRRVGYRLHDGYHGGGAYSMFPFDQGGFYWDTGCCKLICDGTIQLQHSEIARFSKDGVVYKDGSTQQADVVVFATGYMNSKSAIQALLGDEMAKKCYERWEKGNAFFFGPEGESLINYCPLPQKGLYAMFHQFAFSRFHSARLALRIKAEELGIDVTPYANKPLGPPSTAAGRQPRPKGVPL